MKLNVFNLNGVTMVSYVVAAIAFLFIYTVFADKRVPMIASDKVAFFALWVIGLAMSILAGMRDFPDGKFTMSGIPLTFLMALGALAFGRLVVKLIGLKLPGIISYRQAFNLTAGIIILKWVMVHLYKLWSVVQNL